ncbi:MAG TPA: hypothetical protein VKU83_09085 [Puia sp.]|nr:hypothetical protein [Puia sp.]
MKKLRSIWLLTTLLCGAQALRAQALRAQGDSAGRVMRTQEDSAGRVTRAQEDTAKKEHKFTVKGYLKYLELASFTGDATKLITDQLIHNRLNLRYQPDAYWNLRLEVRNRIYYGQLVQSYPGFDSLVTSGGGTLDLSRNWVARNAVLANSTIDRASVEYSRGKWDITAGRQRINWGINTVWTPNDIFNTFNYFDFDYEERPGSDAARVQYNFTGSSSLELAASPGKTPGKDIAAALLHLNRWSYDFQVFSGVYQQDITAGAGWAGNIGGAGFKGEFSYFDPLRKNADTAAFVTSLSVDYAFRDGIYVLVSGLYNSQGGNSLINITQLQSATLSAKNIFPFRYTAFAEASYSFSPILKSSFAGMYSPSGNSLILLPTLTYSIANNWTLDLVAQSFFSRQDGSYRGIGTSLYLRIKWGF